jgi:hypothetical protein
MLQAKAAKGGAAAASATPAAGAADVNTDASDGSAGIAVSTKKQRANPGLYLFVRHQLTS